jgi:hypothetical protein
MASVRGILNIQSLNELTYEKDFGRRAPCTSVWCPQTLIFGRTKATHRPKATHA